MNPDLITTSRIVNGYWYSFTYAAANPSANVDQAPFVYVIQPSETDINNFIGLNMHHLTMPQRKLLLTLMSDKYNIMSKDIRTVLSKKQLCNLVPGCGIAFREYRREGILDCVRVTSNNVAKYIHTNGYLTMETPLNTFQDWLLKRSGHLNDGQDKKEKK